MIAEWDTLRALPPPPLVVSIPQDRETERGEFLSCEPHWEFGCVGGVRTSLSMYVAVCMLQLTLWNVDCRGDGCSEACGCGIERNAPSCEQRQHGQVGPVFVSC